MMLDNQEVLEEQVRVEQVPLELVLEIQQLLVLTQVEVLVVEIMEVAQVDLVMQVQV